MDRRLFIVLFSFISCLKDRPPTVEITTPEDGSRVTGQVVIQAIASDDLGIKDVQFYVGDSLIGTDTAKPYIGWWDTDSTENLTTHTVIVLAYDTKDQTDHDSIHLTVDHSLSPPVVNSFDTSLVHSTSLWLIWDVVDAESISLYRSLSPNIDTIANFLITLPASVDSIHDLWLNQDIHYYYIIIAKDNEGQRARSSVIDVKTARSLTITWSTVGIWTKDGPYLRASSPEELRYWIGDSANPYIQNGFIDFTLQPYKGKLTSDSPDTNHLSLYLFDMENSINAKAVYDSVDPGYTIPYDSVGDEARYYFDSKHAFLDFRQNFAFVRIYIDSGLPQAVEILKKFATYVSALI